MKHLLACHEIVKTDFVRAENCALYDSQGRRYLDFESGIWCTALGHCHPRINRVIQHQSVRLMHLGTRYPNALAEQAAQDVLGLVGMKDGKCAFLSSGSEAVEFGVEIARRVTGKPALLTFSNSYLAAYGSAGKKRPAEWQLLDWTALARTDDFSCLDEIPFGDLGGFVFEPGGSGSGFVRFPPSALVDEIARRVKAAGGLLMANEITTGMGRTGRWFGYQHYAFQPDVVSIGKGLGNGYPVSAVAMRLPVAQAAEDGGFHYAQSHQNDPLGCAVASEVIAVLQEENWIERGRAQGEYFLAGLKRLGEMYPVVKEARGRGMLLALEFQPQAPVSATWAYHALLEQGFLVGYYPAGNIVRFDPALTMQQADVTSLLECLAGLLSGIGDRRMPDTD